MIGYVCAAFASQITDKVIMCGNSAAKLELAKKYGWETIALETDNFEERINALTDGEGVDVVMEVVGSNQAICNAVAAAGPNSTIVLVGNPKADHGKEFILENFKKIHHFTWILEFQL